MPIVNDDGAYETAMDQAVSVLPPELKRIYVEGENTKDEGVIDPEKAQRQIEQGRDSRIIYDDSGNAVDYDLTIPKEITPEIDWSKMNQPFGAIKGTAPIDTPVVAKTASPLVTIREGDIGEATNVAMSAGPASVEKATGKILDKQFLKNYVDSFIKQPEFKKPVPDKYAGLDDTDKALAQIAEALGDTKYADEIVAQNVTKQAKALKTEVSSLLEDMTPKQAADKYWEILTTKGDYSAGKFDHNYWKAAKGTSAHEQFSEHIIKKHKENPNQQIPFEAAPEAPKGWDYVGDFKQSHPIEEVPKLSPKEQFAKDTEYLQNRMKAEMVELEAQFAALNSRAAEAGYTTPAFRGIHLHGEGAEVNPVYNFGKSPALYSSESPMLADMYSSYLSHHPGYKVPENTFGQGASVVPVYINTSKYHVADAEGRVWNEFNSKAIKEAKKKGAPGVVIKNVFDEPNSTFALGKPKTIYITFEEGAGTIKSRFAERFDPKDKNMLKMIPAIAVGGSAGYVAVKAEDEQQN